MTVHSKTRGGYYSSVALQNLQKRIKNNFRVIEKEAEILEKRRQKLLIDEVSKRYSQIILRLNFLESDGLNYLLNLKVGNLIFGEELERFNKAEGIKFLMEYALFIFYSKRKEELKIDTRSDGFNVEDFLEGVSVFNQNFKVFQIKKTETGKYFIIWFEVPA